MTNFEWGSKLNVLPYGMLYLMSALFFGTAVIYQPVIAIAAVLLIILLGISISRPELISYFVLITTAISINFLYDGSMFGMEILSLYKLVIVMLLVPCILVNGLRFRLSHPLWAMVALLVITFGSSIWLPEMTSSIAVKAFIGLSIPFVFLLINWKKNVAELQIKIICMLPLVSVVVGLLLQLAHVHNFLNIEYTGAVRIQGANIPAHLAMLAFMGVAIPFIEVKRNPQQARFFYIMLVLNFFILIGTGTRGPILALGLTVLYYFYDILRQYLKGRTYLLIPLLGAFFLIVVAVFWQLDNFEKRSFERQTDTAVDLSGRSEAWEYFLNKAADSPWSGRGLGAVTVANDGTLYKGFVVPHNEYIRFYFDGGYIGAILLMFSLLAVFILVYRALAPPIKPYYLLFIAAFLIYSFSDNTLSTVQFIIPFCWYLNCLYRSSQPTDSPQKRSDTMNQVNMFDVNFDNYDFMDLLDYIDKTIQERNQSYILTCNVDHVIKLRKDKEFQTVYSKAGAVVADGMPLIWASKMLGKPLKQKVSGADLFNRLGNAFEQRKYRLFFLGSAEGVAERAAMNLKTAHPGINVVGCYSPSYGFEHNEEENERIIEMLTECQPDIVFVGVGAPKQEKWIYRHYTSYQAPISIGVGATFDFMSGSVKRAPSFMQKTGFEWFWRLSQEPGRLWKRYLVDDAQFLLLLLKELRKRDKVKEGGLE